MTTAATLSSANQIARGTWRAAPLVSSEAPTQASKPMNTQPPTASAASMPAPTDPSESVLGAESLREDGEGLRAEDEQERQSDPDRRNDLGSDAGLDHTAEHVDPECADGRADEHENHPGRHDRVRRRRDTYQSECPGSAEVGDRRVGHSVGADRHPAAEPAVGAAHQAAAPLVRAARDRKLRGELGVHGQQQTLAGERDRQHPDPGRACHDGADEHDCVEPDDGRGCGEPHRGVVEEAKPTRELLPVPQLREPLPRRDRAAARPRDSCLLRAVELASRVFDRASDLDPGRDAQLLEDVTHVRLDGLAAQEELCCDLAIRLAVCCQRGDLELTLGQRREPAVSLQLAGPRVSALAPSRRSSRRVSSRTRSEPHSSSSRSARRNTATAS